MKPPQAAYMSLKDASAYSTLSIPCLRNHISEGDLPCYKVGGKWLVNINEFDHWIKSHRVNQGDDISMAVDDIVASFKD